jgi:hypothetical protein
MANSFPFLTAYDLPEIQFIAGTSQELVFYVYTSASVPVNLSGAGVTWKMGYFGQNETILGKVGVTSGSQNYFTVYLHNADTDGLSGKMIHQYDIVDTSGSTFRPSQGIINILPNLPSTIISFV